MHAIEEAKGCMQKGKDFNRLQAKFFWRKPFSGETPSLGEKPFWGEAIFGEKPFWGEAIKKIPCRLCHICRIRLVTDILESISSKTEH